MRAAYICGVHCAVLLAGCFAAQAGQLADDPDAPWIPGLPIANSFAGIVELDSDPAGAEATTSLGGGGCRTPCSLEISAEGPFTVTFTREGYEPTTVEVKIQHARMGVSERKFAPNPVVAQLAALAPPPPAPKKPVAIAHPPQPPKAAPRKPVAAVQPAAQPVPAAPPAAQPVPTAQPVPAAPPAAQPVPTAQPAAPPAARPVPASSAWPAEVKPIPGINSGQIVPAAPPRSSDTPVARRWLEDFKRAPE